MVYAHLSMPAISLTTARFRLDFAHSSYTINHCIPLPQPMVAPLSFEWRMLILLFGYAALSCMISRIQKPSVLEKEPRLT